MSKKTKWDGRIPIDPITGNVPHYTDGYVYSNGKIVETTKIDNTVFTDTLYDFEFQRGRSAAFVTAKSLYSQPTTYNIFLHDFEKMIPLLSRGVIHAEFTYCKRGANYGTKLADLD
jgi:hypothetical protein